MKHKKHRKINHKKEKKTSSQAWLFIMLALVFVIAASFAYVSMTLERPTEEAGAAYLTQCEIQGGYCTANPGTLTVVPCPSEYNPLYGLCFNDDVCCKPKCSDSDSGRVYGIKGMTSTDFLSSTDSCHQYPENPDVPIIEPGINSYVTFGSNDNSAVVNPDIQAPYKYLQEYYCSRGEIASEYIYCAQGCVDGACQEFACSDSDGGKNVYVKGLTKFNGRNYTDYCDITTIPAINQNAVSGPQQPGIMPPINNSIFNLTEYYCEDGLVKNFSSRCPDAKECINGACVNVSGPLNVEPNSVNVGVGQSATSIISGGLMPYSISIPPAEPAEATLSGSILTIQGLAPGSTYTEISDSLNAKARVNITVNIAGTGCSCTSCAECTMKLTWNNCTTVILANDIAATGYNCIYSSGSNQRLDCQGKHIKAATSNIQNYGVVVYGSSNFTINNCTIVSGDETSWSVGISVAYSTVKVTNTIIRDFSSFGLVLYQPANITLLDDVICYNTEDLYSMNQGGWVNSYGERNTCDRPNGWTDTGMLPVIGCTYQCTQTRNCTKIGSVCMQYNGIDYTDYCANETILINYTCGSTNEICMATMQDCSAVSRGTSPGYCNNVTKQCDENQSQVVYPDLLISSIERVVYQTGDGLKIIVKNAVNSPAPESKLMLNLVSAGMNIFSDPAIVIPAINGLGEYTLNIPPEDFGPYQITNRTILVTASADYNNVIQESREDNNNLGALRYSNSCSSWNPKNLYSIALAGLGLEAPEDMGFYNLTMILSYNGRIMGQNSRIFEVTRGNVGHHHVCNTNNQCVQVAGAGDNDCGSNSDCLGAGGGNYTCIENWVYGTWSGCLNGIDQRVCYDQRNCRTTNLKPSVCIWDGSRYTQTISCQSSPCTEDWQCEWKCLNTGQEVKVCTDSNNCGTQQYKPAEESRPCKASIFSSWIFWAVIAAVLIAAFLLILFLVILPGAKKKGKKKGREEVEEEKEEAKGEEETETEKEEPENQGKAAAEALKTYVKDAKAAGMKKEEIEEKLIGAGWPQDAVDEALKSF